MSRRAVVVAAAAVLVSLAFLLAVEGCITEYGTIKEGVQAAGAYFTYSYNGLDWPNTFATCRGRKQSPVLLPVTSAGAKKLGAPEAKSSFTYGTLSNATVVNNGHTLQVSLPSGSFKSDVRIPVRGDPKTATGTSILTASNGSVTYVKATPAQLHFHTHSEHVMSGAEYPLELHIVHFIKPDQLASCAAPGCPVVLGIMIALTDNEQDVSPQLRQIIEAMPLSEGSTASLPKDLDVGALLPTDRTYLTYEGSLTTPPCTEGILWHVLTTPIKINQGLLTHYLEAVGDQYCPDQDKGKDKGKGGTRASAGSDFKPPTGDGGCAKLANGHNYRAVQPLNDRTIKLAT